MLLLRMLLLLFMLLFIPMLGILFGPIPIIIGIIPIGPAKQQSRVHVSELTHPVRLFQE